MTDLTTVMTARCVYKYSGLESMSEVKCVKESPKSFRHFHDFGSVDLQLGGWVAISLSLRDVMVH